MKLSERTHQDYIPLTQAVLAQAVVDELEPNRPVPLWSVHAWTQPPMPITRTYDIEARTDTLAAQEGIRRIVDEAANLRSAG